MDNLCKVLIAHYMKDGTYEDIERLMALQLDDEVVDAAKKLLAADARRKIGIGQSKPKPGTGYKAPTVV
ncbi:MAG: hypothetical protein OXG44_08465 [Gammaproteobacteria bacterium]|nr:hypothetical protein [Gammaproteobacteria bacterium]